MQSIVQICWIILNFVHFFLLMSEYTSKNYGWRWCEPHLLNSENFHIYRLSLCIQITFSLFLYTLYTLYYYTVLLFTLSELQTCTIAEMNFLIFVLARHTSKQMYAKFDHGIFHWGAKISCSIAPVFTCR